MQAHTHCKLYVHNTCTQTACILHSMQWYICHAIVSSTSFLILPLPLSFPSSLPCSLPPSPLSFALSLSPSLPSLLCSLPLSLPPPPPSLSPILSPSFLSISLPHSLSPLPSPSMHTHTGESVDLKDHLYDPNVIASTLKLYLRELPEPLIAPRLAAKFEAIASKPCDSIKTNA